MQIRAVLLAAVLSVPLCAGATLAAETGRQSLVDAARQGHDAVRAVLASRAKDDVAGPEGVAALLWAADRNDLELAELLLRAGANPKGANEYGATALYAAAASTDPAMAVKLLAAGADVNAHLVSGETPLMAAAERGNLAVVRVLLAAGADPNAQEANGGQNALMWAVSEHHADVADELVRHGADVGAHSKRGFTALMFAARQGDVDSARILLEAEANPNDLMPKTGMTALLIAGAWGQADVVTLLLDHGADPNVVDANGFTALHHAVWDKAFVAGKSHGSAHRAEWDRDALMMIKALLAHGAKPDIRLVQKKNPTVTVSGISLAGATPLALAAEINNLEAVKLLAAAGADPLIATDHGTTPLMLAAGAGTDLSNARQPDERATAVETAKYLVERGADVNAVGQFGWTAMHSAAFQGLNDVVAYLIAKGASPDVKDEFGQTPLSISYAIITPGVEHHYYQSPRVFRRDTADLLLKLGATPLERSGVVTLSQRAAEQGQMNVKSILLAAVLGVPLAGAAFAAETGHPLADAARQGDRAAVQSWLGSATKDELAGPEGTAGLLAAAGRNDLGMVDLLLHAGIDPKAANEYGATALYAAAGNPDPAMTNKLLAAGADANAHLVSGETPLMAAAQRGNLAVVQALLAAGADPNARESNGGQNALMWGIFERHSGVTGELVKHGADINAAAKSGFTALMFAARQGDVDSAKILLGAEANPNELAPKTKLTPLLVASATAHTKMAVLLLDKGADPNAVDATGYTSLHYAALRKGATGVITALLAHGAKPNVRLHMARPTDYVSGVSRQGATPLALAAEINNLDAVKALVAGGADPLIPTEAGTTPLMLAAGAGSDVAGARPLQERATAVETARFLIDHGADVNAVGQFGWTALHAACYQGLNDVVALLVAKGAHMETQDSFGQTPLSIANAVVTKGLGGAYYQTPRNLKRDTAELLLKLGATPLDKSGVVAVVRRAGE